MGRAFEYRKATKLKRWGHMARTFTKLGKEIAIAVKGEVVLNLKIIRAFEPLLLPAKGKICPRITLQEQ